MTIKISFRKSDVTVRTNNFPKMVSSWKAYYLTPSLCKECGCPNDWFSRNNTFCNNSCSTVHNMKLRKVNGYTESVDTKQKRIRTQTSKLKMQGLVVQVLQQYVY